MKLTFRRAMLINLGVAFGFTFVVNVALLIMNPNGLQPLREPSLIELAARSGEGNTFQVLLLGIRDLYDAERLTITPDVLERVGLSAEYARQYSGVSEIVVQALDAPPITIPPDALIYGDLPVPIIFLPTQNPHLLVILQGDAVIVTEQSG